MEYTLVLKMKTLALSHPPMKMHQHHQPSSSRRSVAFPRVVRPPGLRIRASAAAQPEPEPVPALLKNPDPVSKNPDPKNPEAAADPTLIQQMQDFNNNYSSPITTFNEFVDSFSVYFKPVGPILGGLKLIWDWTHEKDGSFQTIKILAYKNRAYLGIAAIIVAIAIATIMRRKKRHDHPFGQAKAKDNTPNS